MYYAEPLIGCGLPGSPLQQEAVLQCLAGVGAGGAAINISQPGGAGLNAVRDCSLFMPRSRDDHGAAGSHYRA